VEQTQQRKLDSLRRVQDFLDANADTVGALKDSAGRKQLDDAVTAITTHSSGQAATDLDLAGQKAQQKALVKDLRQQHMVPIARFARAKLRGAPDFAALTNSGFLLQPTQLVRAARAMATAAAPHADSFTASGFPADTVAQLAAAATSLESTIAGRANAKVARVGATKGIREELVKGREAVSMLNAVVSKQFLQDKPFLAAWRAAHRVTAKPGAARGAPAAADTNGTAAPAMAAAPSPSATQAQA